jgi:multidrug efflux pump subunit AcrA (membrane-fusion protein)
MNRRFSIVILCFGFIVHLSCSSEKPQNEGSETSEAIKERINRVLAVGKVVPASGWVRISSKVSGVVLSQKVALGDSVRFGQVLATIDPGVQELDLKQVQYQTQSLTQNQAADLQELRSEEEKLDRLYKVYQTTQALYDKQAETREQLEQDAEQYKQQLIRVSVAKSRVSANVSEQKAQIISEKKVRQTLSQYQITAPQAGVITEWNVDIGQNLQAELTIGTLIGDDSVYIEAEVDELFADKMALNQTVQILSLDRKDTIGTGNIIYVSPTLSNKSILYETVGEASDRRVRLIKVKPNQSKNWLINAKVSCQIEI